jgi:plasmid stabilization system protein ParE
VQVVWSPSALRQIGHIHAYIADFNPAAAFATALIEADDSLALFPHRGRLVRGTALRDWALVYHYIIRYRIAGDTV